VAVWGCCYSGASSETVEHFWSCDVSTTSSSLSHAASLAVNLAMITMMTMMIYQICRGDTKRRRDDGTDDGSIITVNCAGVQRPVVSNSWRPADNDGPSNWVMEQDDGSWPVV